MQVFNENDVLKRMGLTVIRDEEEVSRLLKADHRRFMEKLVQETELWEILEA